MEQGQEKKERLSISLSAEHHQELARIAQQRKVSVAWVVRDAIEKYLTELYPLFPPGVAERRR